MKDQIRIEILQHELEQAKDDVSLWRGAAAGAIALLVTLVLSIEGICGL